jgi:hypothetical protein
MQHNCLPVLDGDVEGWCAGIRDARGLQSVSGRQRRGVVSGSLAFLQLPNLFLKFVNLGAQRLEKCEAHKSICMKDYSGCKVLTHELMHRVIRRGCIIPCWLPSAPPLALSCPLLVASSFAAT